VLGGGAIDLRRVLDGRGLGIVGRYRTEGKSPYNSFREIAPNLPRHHVTPAKFVYLRRELLAWLGER